MSHIGGTYYKLLYLCMDLIDFLKANHTYLNLQKIENKCGIPVTTLKGVVYKGRKLKQKYADEVINLLSFVDLEYNHVDKRKKPVKEEPKLLPMKTGEWKPSIRGRWTNGIITRIPVIVDGEMYYEP